MNVPALRPQELLYPESDGKPMAETDVHRDLLLELIEALRWRFRGEERLYVSGNLFVYYEEGNPAAVVAPDVFVVRGVQGGRRRIFKVWEEGKGPDLVIELTSRSTHIEDLGNKRAIYEGLGVREYFIFDPEGDRFDPPFRAFRLEEGALRPVPPATSADGGWTVFRSETLGLELRGRGEELRWADPATGALLPTLLDLGQRVEEQARAAEEQRRAAEEQRQAAEEQRSLADEARARAEAAEAELARLRAERGRGQD